MRKLSFLFLLAAGIFSANAQDVITMRNGNEIKAKVTEITSSEIKYKRFENLEGPTVVVAKSEVFAINYENGTREVINSMTTSTSNAVRTTTQSYAIDPQKPTFGIYANPIGFATFGPMIGAELTAGKLIAELNFRFPSMGLLMPIVDDCEKLTGGIGIGVGLKFYNARPKGGLYVGGLLEYNNYKTSETDGGYSEVAAIAFGANIGYKFAFSSGLYLRTGGYLGSNFNTKYHQYNRSGSMDDWTGSVYLFGLVDLAIGINF